MKRFILENLNDWKKRKDRKPLILKGARQVGKTFALIDFGKNYFKNYHYFNFEQRDDLHEIFNTTLNPKEIITSLSFNIEKKIDIKNDLIIFDEIQNCPKALTSLKYFYESLPELHLCSAGSLLGLELSSSSFPVGKVEYLHLFPMSFEEFLSGIEDTLGYEFVENFSFNKPKSLLPAIHKHLWEKFKLYLITGGLPEIVNTLKASKEDIFTACNIVRKTQKELFSSYLADIAKHSGKTNALHIERIWKDIPLQLCKTIDGTSKRFRFKEIVPGLHSYTHLIHAFDWLVKANLSIKVQLIDHISSPIKTNIKENLFKLFMFDVGLLGMMADIPPKTILDYGFGTYQGFFIENFIAQELKFLDNDSSRFYSWTSGNAEIEFVYDFGNKAGIVPIEVKSGWVTKSKSLKSYVDKYNPKNKIILSANPIDINYKEGFYKVPLYLISNLFKYFSNL